MHQSFGGTNNNVFLRAVKTGAPCTNKTIAPSGNLDAEKLSNESQHLADALKSGLEWNIVRGEVAKRWPSYISLGSNALNTRGTSEVSELEGMITMQQTYKHAIEVLKHSPSVAGEIAVAEAIRSQPFWRGWASALLHLAMCVTPEQLKEAAQCKAAVVKVPDGVGNTYGFCGGQYLEKAASISFPNSLIQYPRIKMAAFTANMLSPIDKIFDGKYSLLKESDLSKLTSKGAAAEVTLASKRMDEARELCLKHNVDPHNKSRLLVNHDARLIYYLTKKGKQSKHAAEHKCLENAAQVFLQDLSKVIGKDVSGEWGHAQADASAPAERKVTSTSNANMSTSSIVQSMDDMKSAKVQMHLAGFVIGGLVKKKDAPHVCKITDMDDTKAVLMPTGVHTGSGIVPVPLPLLKKEWSVFKSKEQTRLEFQVMQPDMSLAWQVDIQKTHIMLALEELYKKYKQLQGPETIEIWENPVVVKSLVPFKTGGLKLVPVTRGIKDKNLSNSVGNSEKISEKVDLGKLIGAPWDEIQFSLAPCFSTKELSKYWVAPYWLVGPTPKEQPSMANMIYVKEVVNGIPFPIMKNKCVIKPGDALLLEPHVPEESEQPPVKKPKKAAT